MKGLVLIFFVLIAYACCGQNIKGKYFQLGRDSVFIELGPFHLYQQVSEKFQTSGKWKKSADTILLKVKHEESRSHMRFSVFGGKKKKYFRVEKYILSDKTLTRIKDGKRNTEIFYKK
ncbi:MAG: hypothetical protein K0S32_1983 [Bacteroidetes bacterium]|jgi:hypothetical protein|nr:hypothetical protein [Bacteroidota bacterium]